MRHPAPTFRGLALAALAPAFLLASCEDTTVTAVRGAALSVSPSDGSLSPGDTLTLSATLRDAAGNPLPGRSIEWWSEADEIAVVDPSGRVEALGLGSTRIWASSDGSEGYSTITVSHAPRVSLSDTDLDLEAVSGSKEPEVRQVLVRNSGQGTISGLEVATAFEDGEPEGWLEWALDRTEAPAELTLQLRAEHLVEGTYHGRIEVRSPSAENSPQTLHITLRVVAPAPAIGVSASALGFVWEEGRPLPPPRSVSIANGGGGELDGLTTSIQHPEGQPTGWLRVELNGSSAPTEVSFVVDPRTLDAGVYEAVVSIASSAAVNSPQEIRVRLTVGAAPPEIALDTESVGFSLRSGEPNPPVRQVDVRNRGTGALSDLFVEVLHAQGSPVWLQASLSSSFTPATVTLSITDGDLPPGQYEATLKIGSPAAINEPSIAVELEVLPGIDPGRSSLAAQPSVIPADGTSTATVAVTLRDSAGDPVDSGGAAVHLSTTAGTLGTVTDRDDGTYVATLTAPTEPGIATISGTVDGEPLGGTATVEFALDDPDPAPAAIVRIAGDGQEGTVGEPLDDHLVVEVRNQGGNPVSGIRVDWSPAEGSTDPQSSVTDSDGRAGTTWTLGTTAGTQSLSARAEGVPDTVTFQATATAADSAYATISRISYSTSGAGQHLRVTVAAVDEQDNPLPNASIAVVITNTDTGRTWEYADTTDGSGSIVAPVNHHPEGCYVTTVTILSISGLSWNGVTPGNGYCKL